MTDTDPPPRYRTSMSIAHVDGFRTYFALDQKTGRPVLVHLPDADTPNVRLALAMQITQLEPADAALVVDSGDTDRGWAIITQAAEGMNLFAAWLASRHVAAPTPAEPARALSPPTPAESAPVPPVTSAPRAAMGEFTQMFMAPTLPPPAPTSLPAGTTPLPPIVPLAPATPLSATPLPGTTPPVPEVLLPPPPVAAPGPIPAAAPSPSRAAPGEFTQMFMAPALPPSSLPPVAAPLAMPPLGADSLAPLAPLPPLPPRAIEPPRADARQMPMPEFRVSDAAVTPVSFAPSSRAPAVPAVLPPPLFDLSNGEQSAGGAGRARPKSEYTAIISVPVLAPPAPTPPADPSPTPGAAAKGRMSLPVMLAISAIMCVAVALILYFVFRPAPVPPAAAGGAVTGDSVKSAADSAARVDTAAARR